MTILIINLENFSELLQLLKLYLIIYLISILVSILGNIYVFII